MVNSYNYFLVSSLFSNYIKPSRSDFTFSKSFELMPILLGIELVSGESYGCFYSLITALGCSSARLGRSLRFIRGLKCGATSSGCSIATLLRPCVTLETPADDLLYLKLSSSSKLLFSGTSFSSNRLTSRIGSSSFSFFGAYYSSFVSGVISSKDLLTCGAARNILVSVMLFLMAASSSASRSFLFTRELANCGPLDYLELSLS